ncbi:MAG: RNA polymerase sigma factor SigZ [Amphritea sp.]
MNIEDVWAEYRASLKAFLHSKVSDPDEVDDLLQDILIKTYGNLHTLKSASSVKSWLFQIANNVIIDFYRKRAKSRELSTGDISADNLWYGETNPDIRQALSRCVEPFIDALPYETGELLTAIDLHGQSQKDYAGELGISYSTLKSRVQKGRSLLRDLFDECCHFSLDQHGNLIDYDTKTKNCKKC